MEINITRESEHLKHNPIVGIVTGKYNDHSKHTEGGYLFTQIQICGSNLVAKSKHLFPSPTTHPSPVPSLSLTLPDGTSSLTKTKKVVSCSYLCKEQVPYMYVQGIPNVTGTHT